MCLTYKERDLGTNDSKAFVCSGNPTAPEPMKTTVLEKHKRMKKGIGTVEDKHWVL